MARSGFWRRRQSAFSITPRVNPRARTEGRITAPFRLVYQLEGVSKSIELDFTKHLRRSYSKRSVSRQHLSRFTLFTIPCLGIIACDFFTATASGDNTSLCRDHRLAHSDYSRPILPLRAGSSERNARLSPAAVLTFVSCARAIQIRAHFTLEYRLGKLHLNLVNLELVICD